MTRVTVVPSNGEIVVAVVFFNGGAWFLAWSGHVSHEAEQCRHFGFEVMIGLLESRTNPTINCLRSYKLRSHLTVFTNELFTANKVSLNFRLHTLKYFFRAKRKLEVCKGPKKSPKTGGGLKMWLEPSRILNFESSNPYHLFVL